MAGFWWIRWLTVPILMYQIAFKTLDNVVNHYQPQISVQANSAPYDDSRTFTRIVLHDVVGSIPFVASSPYSDTSDGLADSVSTLVRRTFCHCCPFQLKRCFFHCSRCCAVSIGRFAGHQQDRSRKVVTYGGPLTGALWLPALWLPGVF